MTHIIDITGQHQRCLFIVYTFTFEDIEMPNLFSPIKIGALSLTHRVVLAPLTRMRSDKGDMPTKMMIKYYEQRASEGGLIISEAATVSLRGRAYYGAPGIYNEDQVAAWKPITEAVHNKGGKIFMQIWHGGRQSHSDNEPNNDTPIGPSALNANVQAHTPNGWKDTVVPRALEVHEIPAIVDEFRTAARLAAKAGFDGVEIHSANGYLPDQFLQDGSNHRTDEYGGSIPNRARFLLEVTQAVVDELGGSRVAVRISPSTSFGGMFDSNSEATFGYIADQLNQFNLAYLHIIEPRVAGDASVENDVPPVAAGTLRKVFKGPIIAAGGFNSDSANDLLKAGDADLVAFGRYFIANPDLPERFRLNLPLNPYDRDTFYGGAEEGYVDYPFHSETAVAS
jgi:N-ethylmaleimide reductase